MTVPSGWQCAQLGDKCLIEIGGTPSRNNSNYWDETKETANLWVSIRDLSSRLIMETAEHLSDEGVRHSNVKLQPEGTVLLSFKLTIGRLGIAGRPLYTNEAIAGIRSKVIARDYLYHGLQQWDLLKGVDQAIKGATLNKKKLQKINIEFPSDVDEQNEIARVLSLVDYCYDLTEAQLKKRQRIRQGLLHDLLAFGLDSNGKIRAKGGHGFQRTELGQFPSDWKIDYLDSLAVRGSGHTPNKGRPSYWDGGIKWVSLADSERLDAIWIDDTDKKISKLGLKHSSAVLHPKGTVILSRDAGIGKSAILADEMAVSQHFMAWRCKPNRLDNLYLYYWLQRDKPRFEGIALGSTIPTIGLKFFKEYKIAAPADLEEQRQIARALLSADDSIGQAHLQLIKLRLVKRGLMQELLTGKKRVTALLDQESRREKMYA